MYKLFRSSFFIIFGISLVIYFSSCSKKEEDVIPADLTGKLFINEIYSASGIDWIELYNDAEESIDLSNFSIYDDETDKYQIPSSTSISAKGFLVLICDNTATGLHTNFKLSSDGETITLDDEKSNRIDQVTFPPLKNNQSYGRFPDGTTYFAITASTTQGATNGDTQSPVINDVDHTPLVPGLSDDIEVTVELLALGDISSVTLFYQVDGGAFNQIDMTLSSEMFTGTIPALNTTGKINYYVTATNNKEKTTQSPFSAPDKTYEILLNDDPLPQLKINEFMASNKTCCPDMDGGMEEFDDWIEIYNAGTEAVDIGSLYFSDNKTNPFKSQIPTDNPSATTIPSGGFLLLWADGDTDQGVLHLDFKLSADGEDIGIYYFDGRAIDEYTFSAQSENTSRGLTTDGGSTWANFTDPTPGASNE